MSDSGRKLARAGALPVHWLPVSVLILGVIPSELEGSCFFPSGSLLAFFFHDEANPSPAACLSNQNHSAFFSASVSFLPMPRNYVYVCRKHRFYQ